MQIDDEDEVLLLLCSLPKIYDHFKETYCMEERLS